MESQEKTAIEASCWHCLSSFLLQEASHCCHTNPTLVCPFCFKCMCDAPLDFLEKFRRIMESAGLSLAKAAPGTSSPYIKIGEILVGAGKITPDQLNEALERQKSVNKKIGEILIMMALITPDELQLYLLNQKQVSTIELRPDKIDFSLFNRLGNDFCLAHKIVPIEVQEIRNETILRFALLSMENLNEVKNDKRFKDVKLIPYLAKKDEVENILTLLQTRKKKISTITETDATAPLALLNRILLKALESDVSDIILRLAGEELGVSYRSGENLIPLKTEIPSPREFFRQVREIAGFSLSSPRIPKKSCLRLSEKFSNFYIRSYFIQGRGEEFLQLKINRIRELEQDSSSLPLDNWEQTGLNYALAAKKGLFLVCGPGYNRIPETLYSLMNTLKSRNERVASVEPCLLMQNPGVFQVEVDEPEIGMDLYDKLVSFEPDALFLQDFFNKNYHRKFLTFAERGKLFISCQADSFPELFARFKDEFGIPAVFFKEKTRLYLFQRLLKILCPACKTLAGTPTPAAFKSLNLSRNVSLYKAQGCEDCLQSGFVASSKIIELFAPNDLERKSLQDEDIINPGKLVVTSGGRNLASKAFHHFLKGETTLEEYQRFF